MCGIIGYVGKKAASPILLEGLRRLEYRGYDSAGVALVCGGDLLVRKKKGKIGEGLARLLKSEPVEGNLGIGHTRWATHGPPSDKNSHPQLDQSGKIAIVHNGVIENYDALKQKLLEAGHTFKSDTDTEVLAHLIGDYYEKRQSRKSEIGNRQRADPGRLRRAPRSHRHLRPRGDFRRPAGHHRRRAARFAAHHRHRHGRKFSGQRRQCHCRAAHTKKVVYLNDYDVATITPDRFDVLNLGTDTANVQISNLEFSQEDAVRGKYAHFMLKEIFEQPRTVENALRGRVDNEGATARVRRPESDGRRVALD